MLVILKLQHGFQTKLGFGRGRFVKFGNEANIKIDNNLDSFFEFCKKEYNPIIYFHNLKFDGAFIICWLLSHGFKYIDDKKDRKEFTFTSLITDLGLYYSIEVYFKVGNKSVRKVTFLDSLKIIPFSVSQIAKSFNIQEQKLEIDYNLKRDKGHILTTEENEYIKHDVVIVAKALNVLFQEKLTKMTQGSNALHDFTEMITKKRFNHYFPKLDKWADEDIRKAYKGRIHIFEQNL